MDPETVLAELKAASALLEKWQRMVADFTDAPQGAMMNIAPMFSAEIGYVSDKLGALAMRIIPDE